MTVKLLVLYTHPDDADAFDRQYADVHMPLVSTIPGLLRTETGKVGAPLDGGDKTFYRVTELYFADGAGPGRSALDPVVQVHDAAAETAFGD